jgi:hypothetical protein
MPGASIVALYRGHHRAHVWDIHQDADPRRLLRIDEGADVGDAERAEELLPLREVDLPRGSFGSSVCEPAVGDS